jgi:hypothetical protein
MENLPGTTESTRHKPSSEEKTRIVLTPLTAPRFSIWHVSSGDQKYLYC